MDGADDLERFERELLPLMDDAYTLARYLTRDPHDAQDVVQEAYLRALRYFDTFRGGDARAWVLTIVRHSCYTLRRARAAAAEVQPASDEIVAEAPAAYAADRAALDRDTREALGRALDGLAPEFREAVVLREVHGLSYREIARVAGVPIGTVMSRLARGRALLRRALDPAHAQETALIAKADRAALTSTIARLPTVFREALVLRDIHGLPYREIADVTGVPIGTVMSRLARGRGRLVELLARKPS